MNVQKLVSFLKRETVLSAALALAFLSALAVPPDAAWLGYIDVHTLLLLFSLMAVMAGLQAQGLFARIGGTLLARMRTTRQMVLVLTFLPFLLSMLITNDVALITFVPFALIVLRLADTPSLIVPTVVLQTIAANLGSMFTPMGNPQNLYLYARSGMSTGAFLRLMLPYTLASAVLLLAACLLIPSHPIRNVSAGEQPMPDRRFLLLYGLLFALCLLCVAKVLSPAIAAAAVLICLFLFDRRILPRIDYALLLTFIGFFVFIGNMGRIDGFRTLLSAALTGREVIVSVLLSQVISNVPAALLLSGFTDAYPQLIIGTNLGGLGTLIASMASLISYKQIAASCPQLKRRYFITFTLGNVLMLVLLLLFRLLIG